MSNHETKLDVSIGAMKPHYQLQNSVFFHEVDTNSLRPAGSLRQGPPLNRLHESSLSKLGWYRMDPITKAWNISNGAVKLQDAHHAKVLNCKEHKYQETYNADYYATDKSETDDIFLGIQYSNNILTQKF